MRGYGIAAVALLALSTQAYASCPDDLNELKPRIGHKTVQSQANDEAGCYNNNLRANQAQSETLPQRRDCSVPDAIQPQRAAADNGGTPDAGAPAPMLRASVGGETVPAVERLGPREEAGLDRRQFVASRARQHLLTHPATLSGLWKKREVS